jgi:transcription antitermination factor NusG
MPNCEGKVQNSLNKIGIVTFLPLHSVVRQWSDRPKKLEVPLFPNYLFVRISLMDRFRVLCQPGMLRFVGTEKKPDPIREKEIELIRNSSTRNPVLKQ